MSVALLVVVIVLGILLVNAIVWGVVLTSMSRRRRARLATLEESFAATGTRPLLGPARGNYCGGTGDYPKVANNSLITLTATQLLIDPYFGRSVTIGIPEITGCRISKTWRGRVVAGRDFVVVTTARGEVGLYVPDTAGWQAEIERLAQR